MVANTQNVQSQELATKLWAIANDLRGSMDASKFKDYILGIIFYRYLSERTENYMDDLLKNDGVTYREALADPSMAPTVKKWSIDYLGYTIEPEYLFDSYIDEINVKKFSIDHLENGISSLTESTLGQESEVAFDKLFDDMNLQDKDLGKEVSDRTELISRVMLKIHDINFDLDGAYVDVLGTAYMILIGLFASDAGKKGGEFFTPACASELVAKLATYGLTEVESVYDPCAGSGSLLLQVQDQITSHDVTHFYAQEKNGTTYNLLRMNLLMHGVPYKKFSTYNGDTLKIDNFSNTKFQVQVSNPPYSAKHTMGKNYESDPRYSGAGVLAPKARADLAFVEHMVYHMDKNGIISVLLPHGVLFRGDNEDIIRRYLINDLNCIDAIIGLPRNLFHGATLPVICMVLKRNRNGNSNNILFIDASKEYEIDKKQNIMSPANIDNIVRYYSERKEIDKVCHVAKLEEIRANEFDLNLTKYINNFINEDSININEAISNFNNSRAKEAIIDKELSKMLSLLGLEGLV
ncbi:type I restriction-modification system subunit M [Clostridioides sp. ZZV14-6154]|uniref:type I restriction-modification system subunit M n=1 Tax=unclassified Clostridioides TaxID=2635829 RepID=UPI001D112344|nr:type I restriction-modification system subunit M [Clostridioides sp. ZZV14-6154]MCC0670121.1 type I restriction-modification system subunit M [Clostridioides sp. ZZV14-6153]MCC0739169.1 type I restriction-modification system subunit M [Clostridioides sp. ZZV14-5902]